MGRFVTTGHPNDTKSELPVIAESCSPSSSTKTNEPEKSSTAPSQKTTARHDVSGPKPAEDETELDHKSLSRTNTSGARNGVSRILQTFQSLSRTTSQGSDFAPKAPIRNATMQTETSASFDDTAPWDKKAILSLDGGGIRGYSALLIIRSLMRAIGELERGYKAESATSAGPAASSYHPILPTVSATTDTASTTSRDRGDSPITETSSWLPCHYFDYMAGTSTGGLISIMLGRLRMNIDDCIRDYETFGARVFGQSRWFSIRLSPFFWIREKYDHQILENVIKDVVRKRVPKVAGFPGGQNFAFDENRCRVAVIAYQQPEEGEVDKPYLFRTYKNLHKSKGIHGKAMDRNPALAHDIPIWQVARATSAAPTYFKAAKIDDLEYLDGGFGGTNNPSTEICEEVRKMNNRARDCVDIVISIGTGKNNQSSRWRRKNFWKPGSRYINYMNFAKKWASESETQHFNMVKERSNLGFKYYRLNVENGLDEMKLDEWRARGEIRIGAGRCVGKLRKKFDIGAHGGDQSISKPDGRGLEKPPKESVSTETVSSISPKESLESAHLRIPRWLQPQNKTLDDITKYTNEYLAGEEVITWIKECAEILVEARRRRALADPHRWEKTCFDTWYQCTMDECPRAEQKYESLARMRQHLRDKHRDRFRPQADLDQEAASIAATECEKALDQALNECKIIVH